MRKEFALAMEQLALADPKIIFLTGDLGYNALEGLQEKLGERFINTGVAEQNMVGMAAGMAARGYKVFCYSIAPFVVYRCLEQFRNDACLHDLPVFLVGNGGGYGYGIMGSTHHAIEDLAALSSLQNVCCYVPAFANEVEPLLSEMILRNKPAYFRLGAGKNLDNFEEISGSTKIIRTTSKPKGTILGLGPVVHNVPFQEDSQLMTCLTLPFLLTDRVADLIEKSRNLLVIEEHVSIGGLGQQIALQILERGIHLDSFTSLRAEGYPTGRYGDQTFHQTQSGLDSANIAKIIATWK